MNILRIFGIVAAIHAFALLLIFANPGCSSSKGAAPAAAALSDAPAPKPDSVPTITAPVVDAAPPITAPASAAAGALYAPTRPGTPAATAVETEPVSGVTPAAAYTVGRGDSLWSIAKKNHLKVSELAAANHLKAGATLHQGQKLLIPTKGLPAGGDDTSIQASEAPAAASAPAASRAPSHTAAARTGGETKYTVRPGETLGAIAHRFGLRTADLALANSISDPQKIHAGQELTIPAGGHAAATKGSKAAKTSTRTAAASSAGAPSQAPASAASAGPATPPPEIGPAAAAPAPDIPVIKIDGGSSPSSPSK